MMASLKLIAASAVFALATGAASAATQSFTFGVTEGKGQNRDTVLGTTDLNIDSTSSLALGTLDPGDVVGVYGRIVNATDTFAFDFSVAGAFDISFDLDGYLACPTTACTAATARDVTRSGLINEDFLTNDRAANGKSVTFRLFRNGTLIGSELRRTNLYSATAGSGPSALDPTLFTGLGLSTDSFRFEVVGQGRQKALYDVLIRETSVVPLPAGAVLLVTGLAGLLMARRRRGRS